MLISETGSELVPNWHELVPTIEIIPKNYDKLINLHINKLSQVNLLIRKKLKWEKNLI